MDWLIKMFRLYFFKKKWRKHNKHNSTYARDIFPLSSIEVGRYTYGGLKVLTLGEGYKVVIGDFCSIGPNVLFILKADHPVDQISTFPFKVKILGEPYEAISKGNIILSDDVWLGANVTILSGVHIGQGAVVAAGSVVSADVPPYAIVGGIPAKVIKYRFDHKIVSRLININFKELNKREIEEKISYLYTSLNEDNVDLMINQIFGASNNTNAKYN